MAQNDARIDPARHRGEFVPGPSHRPGEFSRLDPPRALTVPFNLIHILRVSLKDSARTSAISSGARKSVYAHGAMALLFGGASACLRRGLRRQPPGLWRMRLADPFWAARDHRLPASPSPASTSASPATSRRPLPACFACAMLHPDPPDLRAVPFLRSGDAGLRGGDGPRPGRPATVPVEPGQRPHRVRPRPAAVADPLARPRAQPAPATQAGVAAAGAGGEESPVIPGRSRPPDRLFNRREFDQLVLMELARSLANRSRSSLLMVDLDHFKYINDRYGHPFGDEVIRHAAKPAARQYP
ncbi:diguanylate cyclase [Pseudomonas aeruginosa]